MNANAASITNNKLRIGRGKSPTTSQAIPALKEKSESVYLHHPLVDLFLICGGWLLMLVPMHAALSGGAIDRATISPFVQTFVLIGLYLISQPHSASTLFKLYGDRETRKRHSIIAYVLPALLIILLVAAIALPLLARIQATCYIALALHHIMAQCYGIAIMYCARAKMELSRVERFLLHSIMWTAVAAAVAEQLSPSYGRNALLGVQLFVFDFIPRGCITALHIATLAAIVIFATLQAQRWIWHKPLIPFPAAMTMLTSVTLLTVWNLQSTLVWVFVPPFFHACQYLAVIMASFVKGAVTKDPTMNAGQIREFSAVRMTELFIVGFVLFVGIPKLISLMGIPFTTASALMFFAINLHHFAADANIWKLRDPRVRRSLT